MRSFVSCVAQYVSPSLLQSAIADSTVLRYEVYATTDIPSGRTRTHHCCL